MILFRTFIFLFVISGCASHMHTTEDFVAAPVSTAASPSAKERAAARKRQVEFVKKQAAAKAKMEADPDYQRAVAIEALKSKRQRQMMEFQRQENDRLISAIQSHNHRHR